MDLTEEVRPDMLAAAFKMISARYSYIHMLPPYTCISGNPENGLMSLDMLAFQIIHIQTLSQLYTCCSVFLYTPELEVHHQGADYNYRNQVHLHLHLHPLPYMYLYLHLHLHLFQGVPASLCSPSKLPPSLPNGGSDLASTSSCSHGTHSTMMDTGLGDATINPPSDAEITNPRIAM